jgi:ABC-type nitrate/sulfonate/bicarbonate transport system substrate-binding protein/outer membrane protein OmpA-like peptidoglycan-associated protein
VALNAGTFFFSALMLLAIRNREPAAKTKVQRREPGWLIRDVREGLRYVFGHPQLEPVIVCGTIYVLFLSALEASLVLYCRDVLHLDALRTGIVIGAAAAGYPVGNILSGTLITRLGVARTLVASATLSVIGIVLMPVAGGAGSVVGLVAGSVVHSTGEGAFGPTSLTLRQTVTPKRLLGRVNSVQRFLIWGMVPLGSMLASVAIMLIGLTGAVWIGALGTVFCLPVLLRRGIREELHIGARPCSRSSQLKESTVSRFRWVPALASLPIACAAVYGGGVSLDIAPAPDQLQIGGRIGQLRTMLLSESISFPPEPETRIQDPTEGPTPVAPAVPVVTIVPTPVSDGTGFRSEVPVPESTGNFPLGTITVAFDKEFPPYSPVVMLYQERLAEKRGLGVHFVPFDIEDKNRISEFRRAQLLQSGGFDILLTTMNSYALWGGPDIGRVTAVIGESAGADKAIVRAGTINTFNDFYGKAVAYSDSSVSEYLLYYMLRAGGVPADAVIRFGQENLNQAVRRYDDREAHAVVGWTSSDLDTAMKQPDSKVLMTSNQFRVTTDVIVTSVRALQTKPAAVQAFHDAWFEANKIVFEHPDEASAAMNAWNGSWTGVETTQDLTDALAEFAQATLEDNRAVFIEQQLPLLEARYKEAQAVWGWGGRKVTQVVHDQDLATVFDPTFVRTSAQDESLISTAPPVNPTFHLTAKPEVKGLAPDEQSRLQAITTLSVKQVHFDQGSTELSAGARQDIEGSVIPLLRNTLGTYLKIEGSAAWPNDPEVSESAVNALAFERARVIEDYIIKFGVPVERLVVSTKLPVCRACSDADQLERDDQVTFTLASPQ